MPKPASNLFLILFLLLAIVASAQRPTRSGIVLGAASRNYHHRVSTKNEEAQRFFDQGLTLIYALDYSEAARAFQRAGALDPTIAMAYWGISYSMSSDYYYPPLATQFANAKPMRRSNKPLRSRQTVPRRSALTFRRLANDFAPARIPTARSRQSSLKTQCAICHKRFPTIWTQPPSTPKAS